MSTVDTHHAIYEPVPVQGCLFTLDDPSIDPAFTQMDRTWLDDDSWVDHAPLWMGGTDVVFGELVARLPWRQREVVMYDQLLPEPRLTSWWNIKSDDFEPLGILADTRRTLTERYSRPFDSIGFNLYRNGQDSVAWHADRERYHHEDPVVAIVSVGSPRPFHLRRRASGDDGIGRESHRFDLGHGDLFVMGGACQHDWEHCVPKIAQAMGPRLSIMFRHDLADWDAPS